MYIIYFALSFGKLPLLFMSYMLFCAQELPKEGLGSMWCWVFESAWLGCKVNDLPIILFLQHLIIF